MLKNKHVVQKTNQVTWVQCSSSVDIKLTEFIMLTNMHGKLNCVQLLCMSPGFRVSIIYLFRHVNDKKGIEVAY